MDPLALPDCPSFDSTVGITNVLKTIGSMQVVTLAADLTLTQPGQWDIWMQVDVFGGPDGLNYEWNGTNNWKYLGQVSLYLTYLPLIIKAH